MTSLLILTALVCLLVDHSLAVVELTDATFYDYAKDKEVLLVDFFAPWCSDCKALEPDFESAAASLGTRSLDLAKVDCFGAGKGLCATYGVRRWPTLKNFNRGSYTGDYNGGLTASEIAGYITTVENSVVPASNPYAMVVPQPIQQACISRCKINKIPDRGNCFQTCKGKSFSTHNGPKRLMNMKMVAQKPVINEKSCAKCRIPQPTGRSHRCSHSVRRACISMHRHLPAAVSAKLLHTRQKTNSYKTTVKKAEIQTLTAASNDNVVKLSLNEPLIVPPNAENKKGSVAPSTGKSKSNPVTDSTKGNTFDITVGDNDAGVKTIDNNIKISDLSTRETLKLINDADDKKTPVLNFPSHNDKLTNEARLVSIDVPQHDSGDKKMGMQRATLKKTEKQINKPKLPIKAIKTSEKHPPIKIQPKFTSLKVPPHDSGDKKADLQKTFPADNNNAIAYPSPNVPSKQGYAVPNNNLKLTSEQTAKTSQSKSEVESMPMNKLTGQQKQKHPVPQSSKKGDVKQLPTNDKIVNIYRNTNKKMINHKNIDHLTPSEALKVPYDADDRKRTMDK